MKIAVIGAGRMGAALGRLWAKAGHAVVLCDVRPIEELEALAREIGHGTRAAHAQEAVADSDVILLAVPWASIRDALARCGSLAGKVVIDVINPHKSDFSDLEIGFTTSASEEIAKLAPGAKVCKALNTLPSPVFNLPECKVSGMKVSGFYCGDDEQAKQIVAQLVSDAGFDPVDCGPLSSARYLEAAGMLLIRIVVALKASPELALTLVRQDKPCC
ncbi:MAG: NADPH-dependent F420 reductase [Candidatus Sumerlaeaceae bacterium]|nr:NADPH-dependent F420 reductase [Candidatus Sumerlaeaceae bacterium]